MTFFAPDHPFTKMCERYQCECTQDVNFGLSIVRSGDAQIAFYGNTEKFLAALGQKRYYRMLPKMLHLAKMGVSPTFSVDKPMLWSDCMMKLECERMADPHIMLMRFFSVVLAPAEQKMKESCDALVCGFRSTGFRYNCENRGNEKYSLDISLAYDMLFVRRVFTLPDIAEQFQLPEDVLLWMGEVGSSAWWTAMRNMALSRNAPILEFELPELDFV